MSIINKQGAPALTLAASHNVVLAYTSSYANLFAPVRNSYSNLTMITHVEKQIWQVLPKSQEPHDGKKFWLENCYLAHLSVTVKATESVKIPVCPSTRGYAFLVMQEIQSKCNDYVTDVPLE